METKLLYIFTRTPLHVGAGSSVGAIDQTIIRERHTGFPLIPASSLKGTFADRWNSELKEEDSEKKKLKVRTTKTGETTEAAWLFGSDNPEHSFAGAVQFTEARLLAFPIRSARGSYAWITSPLLLSRAVRDKVLNKEKLPKFEDLKDQNAMFFKEGPNAINDKIVLEEYSFTYCGEDKLKELALQLSEIMTDDVVWTNVKDRLVILSDGMMSYFAQNACQVAQHVKINDETGTAEPGALFNQEDVPSETMFYSVVHFFDGRGKQFKDKKAKDAVEAFNKKLGNGLFQFGGDSSTGLGWCTVKMV